MPLKDRDRSRPRRLVRLGVIRLGIKKTAQSGFEYPVATDYFVLTDAPEIAEHYGDKPRELDVMLPFADIARNFDAAYTVWAGGVLVCRGDGEYVEYATPHAVSYREKDDKKLLSVKNAPGGTLVSNGLAKDSFEWGEDKFGPGDHVPCPGAQADAYPHCRACKISAILKVLMSKPELFRLGYYQISTGSGKNYDTILGSLELMFEGTGRLNGIPWKLRLVQEPSTYVNEDGQRKSTKNYFLQLEPDPTYTRTLYTNQAAAALRPGIETPQLPAPADYQDVEYDEVDPTIPPPVADVVREVDTQTGEILSEKPVEPEPEKKAEPDKANGKPMARPLTPAQLRKALLSKAGYSLENGIVVSEPKNDPMAKDVAKGLLGLVTGTMNEVFKDQDKPDNMRHSVLKYVFGYDSSGELHLGEVSALRAWLLGDGNELDTLAVKEAWHVIREVYIGAGQLELLPEAEQTLAQFEALGASREKAKDSPPEEVSEEEELEY